MSEREEILIAAEDLEFLQDHIKALSDENKKLKESSNSDLVSKVDEIYEQYSKDLVHETLIDKLSYIQSYLASMQAEREQFADKLSTMFDQKENEAKDKLSNLQLEIDLITKQSDAYKLESDNYKDLKSLLIEHIKTQYKLSITLEDAKSTGSTGDNPKKQDILTPKLDSDNNEFIKSLEKMWKDREDLINDPATKVQTDEIKVWDEKLKKMKDSLSEKNSKILILEKELKETANKVQPLNHKIESMEENEKQLRRMLDETNLLSEGYYRRISELEAQRNALISDVATLEEEVEAARKHATERFTLAIQKQEVEDKLKDITEKYKNLTEEHQEIKERAKLFTEISVKNHKLEEQVGILSHEVESLTALLSSAVKEGSELEQIRQLQDKAIHELYDNEKILKQSLEKLTREHSDYKLEMEAKHK